MQYYKISKTGEMYLLNKSTGVVQKVSSIPSGAAVITWGGSNLPNELATALNKPIGTSVTEVKTTPTTQPQQKSAAQIEQERLEKIEEQRQVYLRQAIKLTSGGKRVRDETIQSFLATVPSEFKNDISNFFGITPETRPSEQGVSDAPTMGDEFQTWLDGQGLSDDFKQMIEALTDAVVTNDEDYVRRIREAISAATEFSDPYFKAQSRMVIDALDRGIAGREGDLVFQEKQLADTLRDLREDISASGEFLSFQQQQELKQLESSYKVQLENKQQSLAATGFTTSTRRARAEQLLTEEKEGLVESSERQLAFRTGALERQESSAVRDTAQQVANLRRLTEEGRIDALRAAEEQVGTTALSDLGKIGLLGDIGGEIPRQEVKSALGFAESFVF